MTTTSSSSSYCSNNIISQPQYENNNMVVKRQSKQQQQSKRTNNNNNNNNNRKVTLSSSSSSSLGRRREVGIIDPSNCSSGGSTCSASSHTSSSSRDVSIVDPNKNETTTTTTAMTMTGSSSSNIVYTNKVYFGVRIRPISIANSTNTTTATTTTTTTNNNTIKTIPYINCCCPSDTDENDIDTNTAALPTKQIIEVLSPNNTKKNDGKTNNNNNNNVCCYCCYAYDTIYDETMKQKQFYNTIAIPILQSIFEYGNNITIVTYGSIGSGKTHTLIGGGKNNSSSTSTRSNNNNNNYIYSASNSRTSNNNINHNKEDEEAGLIPRFLHSIFEQLQEKKKQSIDDTGEKEQQQQQQYQYEVSLSFFEVYGERVYDLLNNNNNDNNQNSDNTVDNGSNHNDENDNIQNYNKNNTNRSVSETKNKKKKRSHHLHITEDNDNNKVICIGLTEKNVTNDHEAIQLLQQGVQNRRIRRKKRSTAATTTTDAISNDNSNSNSNSSRSHAIFTISITQKIISTVRTTPTTLPYDDDDDFYENNKYLMDDVNNNNNDDNDIITIPRKVTTTATITTSNTIITSRAKTVKLTFVDLSCYSKEKLPKTTTTNNSDNQHQQCYSLFQPSVITTSSASTKSFSSPRQQQHQHQQIHNEGIEINQSLLAVGNLLDALKSNEMKQNKQQQQQKQEQHHGTLLTRLLKDKLLGDNCKTYFLACISADPYNYHETIQTLQCASRACNIRKKSPISIIPSVSLTFEDDDDNDNNTNDNATQEKNRDNNNNYNNYAAVVAAARLELRHLREYVVSLQDELAQYQKSGMSLMSLPVETTTRSCLPNVDNSKEEELPSSDSGNKNDAADTATSNNDAILIENQARELEHVKGILAKQTEELVELRQRLQECQIIQEKYDKLLEDVHVLEQEKEQLGNESTIVTNIINTVKAELAKQEEELTQHRQKLHEYEKMKDQFDSLIKDMQNLHEEEAAYLNEELEEAEQTELSNINNTKFCDNEPSIHYSKTVDGTLPTAPIPSTCTIKDCDREDVQEDCPPVSRKQEDRKTIKCLLLEQRSIHFRNSYIASLLLRKQLDDGEQTQQCDENDLVLSAVKNESIVTVIATATTKDHEEKIDSTQQYHYCTKSVLSHNRDLKTVGKIMTINENDDDEKSCDSDKNDGYNSHNQSPLTNGGTDKSHDACFAELSEEIRSVHSLLEKAVHEKVLYFQVKEEFNEKERKYNNVMKSLEANMKQLNEIKGARLSDRSNDKAVDSAFRDDALDVFLGLKSNDDIGNSTINHSHSPRKDGNNNNRTLLVEELECMIEKNEFDIRKYECELEKMDVILRRCEQRNIYDDKAVRSIIKNWDAPVIRTSFLDLLDTLAKKELKCRQLETTLDNNRAQASKSEDDIAALNDEIWGMKKELSRRDLLIEELKDRSSTIHDDDDDDDEKKEDEHGLLSRLIQNEHRMYYYNAFLKLYFVLSISVVLRGDFIPLRWEPYLHVICGMAGFIAASKELIWDTDDDDSSLSFYILQTFCFLADIVIHVWM